MSTLEDIKKLMPIFAIVVALAGFYYTTQHRLDHIEDEISDIKVLIKKNKKKRGNND